MIAAGEDIRGWSPENTWKVVVFFVFADHVSRMVRFLLTEFSCSLGRRRWPALTLKETKKNGMVTLSPYRF